MVAAARPRSYGGDAAHKSAKKMSKSFSTTTSNKSMVVFDVRGASNPAFAPITHLFTSGSLPSSQARTRARPVSALTRPF